MLNRAYSILSIKAVREDERVIEGIASTPTPDRTGDIVEPMGAKFSLPMPLLWQHRSSEPVGNVTFAKPNKNGIPFKAQIASTDEPGTLKDRLDEAWQSVKLGLVRAVSIGFTIGAYEILKEGGWRINEWEWLELSLVTIPAQAEATINTVKSIDADLLAATGQKQIGKERTVKAGVTASKFNHAVKEKQAMTKKTISEQISGFEAKRTVQAARQDEIMDAASETGLTLDTAEKEEYDTLDSEIKEIDEHLVRLRSRERSNAAAARAVENIKDSVGASDARGGNVRVQIMPKKLPPGTLFTRYVTALARSRGDLMLAERHVLGNEQWMAETPELCEIIKTAVNAGTTSDSTWAAPLVNYTIMTQEFIDYLRPLTIIGRIPGLRRVPFKVKVPRQTGAATVNWVGEGKVKPLTSIAFDTVTLEFAKIAGIIPLTEELVRFSNPNAEALIREELANAVVQFMDSQFVDPTKASNDVSPASITYNVTPTTATGTTAAAFRADVKTLVGGFLSNNYNTAGLVWLMTQQQALALSLMQNSLGQPVFPGVTIAGGTLVGLPVVTSENIPATGGSPTDGYSIILLNARDILLADDGQVTIDASREASLQMDTAPDSPPTTSTVTVSLWQHNMIAIKAERYINWTKARSTAVAFISSAKYAE
jgi:HK97 family phage major capsid protein/HK97 family phage prohead protease